MSTRVPKYRLHKGSGQALVQINGRRNYLGKYGSEESRQRYRRIVAEWLLGDGTFASTTYQRSDELTTNELILAYWKFANRHYVKDGRPTDEQAGIRAALRFLRRLFGRSRAIDFGPKDLKLVRQSMVDAGLSRKYINHSIGRIKRTFRWAISEELVPVAVYEALKTVEGLRRGRSAAREPEPVQPVPDAVVEATLPHLPPVVADMVRFERLVGCRPTEVCTIRPCDVDRSDKIWAYRPASHKMEHLGRQRVIFVGPRAQAILTSYLLRTADAFCFCPAESERRRRDAARTIPASETPRPEPSKRTRKRPPGQRYRKDSYRTAVQRACRRAGVPSWAPNQLRHTQATLIRAQYGLEAAQVILGHSRADVTQLYAERDHRLAARIAAEVG